MLRRGRYLKERCKETLYRCVAATPGSAAQIERDQGCALDYMSRKRATLNTTWMEMFSVVDARVRSERRRSERRR